MDLFRDYGDWGKSVKLFEAYLQHQAVEGIDEVGEELVESGSTSDFASYMADKATKRLMWGYGDVPSSWRRYTRMFTVNDYKPLSFTRLTEMEDLIEVKEGGEYHDSQIDEIVGPTITVKKFGRLFSLTREALINDDLNQLRDRPAALGRAAARTVGHNIVAFLETNPNSYDGTALFSVAHNNLLSGAQYALAEQPLADAMTKLRLQKDPNGNRIGLRPRTMIIPAELELTARRVLNSTLVPMAGYPRGDVAGAAPPGFGTGGTNVLANAVEYAVEEYLLDPSDWYLIADPNEAPVLGVAFLRGKETPDIMLNDPGMRLVLGGSDPYSMKFDEIWWKVRHEWGTGAMDWRGALKAIVP